MWRFVVGGLALSCALVLFLFCGVGLMDFDDGGYGPWTQDNLVRWLLSLKPEHRMALVTSAVAAPPGLLVGVALIGTGLFHLLRGAWSTSRAGK
jgi:hypothetical protein